jgi:hypothetical protein
MNFVRRKDYMFSYEKSMCTVQKLRRKIWICDFDFLKSVFHFLFFKNFDVSIISLQFVVLSTNFISWTSGIFLFCNACEDDLWLIKNLNFDVSYDNDLMMT